MSEEDEPDDGRMTYSEAYALFERTHAARMRSKGWSREEIDRGRRPKPGGVKDKFTGRQAMEQSLYCRPLPPSTPGIRRTEKEWFAMR